MTRIIFSEDFSGFPQGPYPSNYFATQEYHYLPPKGFTGDWYEATISHLWRPCSAAWILLEQDGKKRMLSTLEASFPHPRILVTGDGGWRNYAVSLRLPLLRAEGRAGLTFRYRTNREYYALVMENNNLIRLLRVCQEEEKVLAEAEFAFDNTRTYKLEAVASENRILARLDGKDLFSCEDNAYREGRIGLYSLTTCFFDHVEVTAGEADCRVFLDLRDRAEKELDALREQYPRPAIAGKISTKGFGAGRQLRFGHLSGDREKLDVLICQNIKLQPEKDDYSAIRCLTALSPDGKILWRKGEPQDSMDAAITTSDLPVQIYDIDGDGFDEVICVKNFNLMILDGRTGDVKKQTRVPNNVQDENRYGYLNADAVIIANVSGKARASDIIIKNRYRQAWVYDADLNPLWSARRPDGDNRPNTGHFPVAYDVDGDGKDGIFAGYTLFDSGGRVIWNHDWPDHTDEIIIGSFDPSRKGLQIATASGDTGFCIFDAASGEVLWKEMLGHAQRISAAKFRGDLPGLQFYCVTFWHHPGIISLHDCTGRTLFSFEPACLGNTLNPVNWRGDGEELALLNTNAKHGGMIDGYGRRVVLFPDDGHPDLCAEAIDVLGDSRSEIVTWDRESIWIYTQDRGAGQGPVYAPIRPPHWNASNYRGEYSFPP